MVSFNRSYRLKRKDRFKKDRYSRSELSMLHVPHSGILCQDNFMVLMIQVKCIFFEVLFLKRIVL
jgi:hypothetical protein